MLARAPRWLVLAVMGLALARCDAPPDAPDDVDAGVDVPPVDTGLAQCRSGTADCDGDLSNGCEVDLLSVDHCGACGNRCPEAPHSVRACGLGVALQCGLRCDEGWGDCDRDPSNGCEARLDTVDHCGQCAVRCSIASATWRCERGACVVDACVGATADCDGDAFNGCERRLDTASDCGGCGRACPTDPNGATACASGVCVTTCLAGWDRCGAASCATSLSTRSDCGACGARCARGQMCVSGRCEGECPANTADCDDTGSCSANLLTDATHCGACDRACTSAPAHAHPSCDGGACAWACDDGRADCNGRADDGCEVDLRRDDANCGGCGVSCGAGGPCSASGCASQRPGYRRPQSLGIATRRAPTFAWYPSAPRYRFEACRDRACTSVISRVELSEAVYRPPAPLPTGVVFWRYTPLAADGSSGETSATWEVVIPDRDLAADTAWTFIVDLDGDGVQERVGANRYVRGGPGVPFENDDVVERIEEEVGGVFEHRDVSVGAYFAGDLDGDGFGDFLMLRYAESTYNGAYRFGDPSYSLYVYQGSPIQPTLGVGIASRRWRHQLSFVSLMGDIGGRGKASVLLQFSDDSSTPETIAWTLDGSVARYGSIRSGEYTIGAVGDLDGDGLSDVTTLGHCYTTLGDPTALRVARFSRGGPAVFLDLVEVEPCAPTTMECVIWGNLSDLNGDGYADGGPFAMGGPGGPIDACPAP